MTLSDLDPDTVARDAVNRVIDHLHSTAIQLDPTLFLQIPEESGFVLRATVRALTIYAQRGLPVRSPHRPRERECHRPGLPAPVHSWTNSGMAADGLLATLSVLYGSSCGGLESTAIDVVDDVDPDDELGLVLVAAAARIRLDQRAPVSARELAALAGVSATYVRRLVRHGELQATDGRPAKIDVDDALRWLGSRGVPGFVDGDHE